MWNLPTCSSRSIVIRKDLSNHISQFEKMFRAFIDNYMKAESEAQEMARLEAEARNATVQQMENSAKKLNDGHKDINVHIHIDRG